MTNETIFRLLAFLLLLSTLSISIYFRHKADREAGKLRTSAGQGLVMWLRLVGLIFILPLLGYLIEPAWVTWARLPLPDWLRWLGAVIGATMIPMVYWVFSSLGLNVSPTQATRQGHHLVKHGPYRWVRHPLYTTGFIFVLAITALTGVWLTGAGLLLGFAVLLWRTRYEEANLIATFGDEYREYMAQTGRYLPRWR